MNAALLIGILFAHWVSDFVLQSRWMGNNKSSDGEAMAAHIATYTGSMIVLLILMHLQQLSGLLLCNILTYVFLNAAVHLVTDIVSSRATKWAWNDKREHLFWCIIGFDQFAHVAVLILTIPLLS